MNVRSKAHQSKFIACSHSTHMSFAVNMRIKIYNKNQISFCSWILRVTHSVSSVKPLDIRTWKWYNHIRLCFVLFENCHLNLCINRANGKFRAYIYMHMQCAEIRSLGQLNVRIVRVHSAINQCVAGPLWESAKIECVQEPIVYVCDVWQTIYFFFTSIFWSAVSRCGNCYLIEQLGRENFCIIMWQW